MSAPRGRDTPTSSGKRKRQDEDENEKTLRELFEDLKRARYSDVFASWDLTAPASAPPSSDPGAVPVVPAITTAPGLESCLPAQPPALLQPEESRPTSPDLYNRWKGLIDEGAFEASLTPDNLNRQESQVSNTSSGTLNGERAAALNDASQNIDFGIDLGFEDIAWGAPILGPAIANNVTDSNMVTFAADSVPNPSSNFGGQGPIACNNFSPTLNQQAAPVPAWASVPVQYPGPAPAPAPAPKEGRNISIKVPGDKGLVEILVEAGKPFSLLTPLEQYAVNHRMVQTSFEKGWEARGKADRKEYRAAAKKELNETGTLFGLRVVLPGDEGGEAGKKAKAPARKRAIDDVLARIGKLGDNDHGKAEQKDLEVSLQTHEGQFPGSRKSPHVSGVLKQMEHGQRLKKS